VGGKESERTPPPFAEYKAKTARLSRWRKTKTRKGLTEIRQKYLSDKVKDPKSS